MSPKPAARVLDMAQEMDILVELAQEDDKLLETPALMIGDPGEGKLYLTTHTCNYCRSSMQTVGVGHGVYECSWCASKRSRRIVMDRKFECLENEE